MSRRRRLWSEADLDILRRAYADTPTALLAARFSRSTACVSQKARTLGLRKNADFMASLESGRMVKGTTRGAGSRFVKGHKTWNTGLRYTAGGRSAETRFLKGAKPHNWRPIGSHRVNAEGYLDRKVRDGHGIRNWVAVHRLVWIEAHGPVPAGYQVRFKAGRFSADLEAITPDALELVSYRDSMLRNSIHNLPEPLVDVIHARAGLVRRIRTAEKKRAEQDQRSA